MLSFSKFKQSFGNSYVLPAAYTFFTKPFSKNLRHLSESPNIPKTPEKVSVVIPNYNYENFLLPRVRSILNQTYPLHELIILDDASTDGSIDFVEKDLLPIIRTKDPDLKLKFIKNRINSGRSISQWQKAFKEATGDFLWIAEADDLSDPNFLAVVMAKFEEAKNVVVSFSNSVAINEKESVLTYNFENKSVDKLKNGRFRTDFIASGEELIKNELAINCIIPNVSSAVFNLTKKIPFEKYLTIASEFAQCGDWYFYLKVLEHGSLAYSLPSMNFFRIHRNSVTAGAKKSETLIEEVKTLHKYLGEKYPLSKRILTAQKTEQARLINRM